MAIDDTVNALIDAVEAIERELGLVPSSVYANVRARLDILEARINNPFAPSPDVENPFVIGNSGVTISTGSGAPSGAAQPGSLYLRQDGYVTLALYSFRSDGYWYQVGASGSSSILNLASFDGYASGGGSFNLTQTAGTAFSPVEGSSYDINLRVLIVNTSGTATCARFVDDILAHVTSGNLILDIVNTTLIDDNGTGWTVSLSASGASLIVTINSSGSDDRRATATLEWRELSRL
jgi:hypothetical protein